MQSSSLYVTDGDEIDWAYGVQRIFMYTFELYPSHSQVSSNARFYPPDEVIGRADRAQPGGDPHAHRGGRLPVLRSVGKARANCGPLFDDFETAGGWDTNPLGTDTATAGAWERANPAATTRQAGTVPSGSRALVTGHRGRRRRPRTTSMAA